MWDAIQEFFSTRAFMPHGHCYLWKPGLLWLQVLSNGAIALAYIAISGTLAYLVRRVRDIPFKLMYLAFGIFIVTCGFTHLMDVWVIWEPMYWLDGSIRAVTAVASIGTAVMLPPLVPQAVALARGARAAHNRGIKLENLVKDLGTMYEKTKELDTLKTQFFANVSHELRTPLSLILGPIERMLSDPNLDDARRRELELVRNNARLLHRQVSDLLELSRLEAGKARLEYAQTDLTGLVRLTAASFETVADGRQIQFSLRTPEALPAEVDPEKVQRVLLNLLSNAFKFTPDGGRIRCELTRASAGNGSNGASAGRAFLVVADSGPGIPEAQRAAVFERFHQLETGEATRRGVGLGLAIVKDLTELHRGKVVVERAPEGGALFRVELPLAAPADAHVEPEREGGASAQQDAARQMASELKSAPVEPALPADEAGQGLVLVVEDNAEMSRFLVQTLSADQRVATAADGAEGLRLARELAPDAVVTDMMMPEMTGEELLGALRADPALAEIPVLVLTARADDDTRLRLLRGGAQDYLIKPFHAEEVRARVTNLAQVKRTRDLLRGQIASREENLEELARAVSTRQQELRTAMESLEVARDQALRASEVKTQFLSLVSHELRTPITSVRLQIDRVLRFSPASPEGERMAAAVRRADVACRRLEELVESLLEYARIQSGRLTVHPEPVDLAQVLHDAAEEMRPLAERKHLALEVEAAPDGRFRTDGRLLRLAVVNLVGNAIKYTESGGVRVHLSGADGWRQIEVRDTGPGIAPDAHGRIFEPFEQLELVREKHTPGVGLGLTLVRDMVTALGGEVWLSSEVGKGSTFTIRLPEVMS